MSNPIIIPGFHGGQAIDPYDPLQKQTFQKAYGLDIFTDQNILTPVNFNLQAMAIPALAGESVVGVRNSYFASNGKWYFLGHATISATVNTVLWSLNALATSPSYLELDATSGASNQKYAMAEYKDGLFYSVNTTDSLRRWGNLSGSASASTISVTINTRITQFLNHRGLGLLFFLHNSGHKIGRYDNTTATSSAIQFEESETVIGMEEYGRWVLIGLRTTGSGKSRFVLWDGSATTVDEVYNIGDSGLQAFKIVNGVIEYVSMTDNGTTGRIRLSSLVPGGKPQIINDQQITLTSGANSIDPNAVSSFGDIFLYGLNGISYSDFDLGIFAHGSSSAGLEKYYALWRLVSTGVTTGVSISSIKHNGSSVIITWGTSTLGAGTQHIDVMGAGITPATPSTGVYETNIFPLNNGLPGKIKKITINHKAIPTSTGFTLSIKHLGNYPFGTTVPSAQAYQDIVGPQGSGSSTGKTQSTNNATFTEVQSPTFTNATHAQIKISFDEVSTTTAPSIVFPILIEVE